MTASDSLLARGIAAAKAGDRSTARRLLTEAVQRDPDSEVAWLWLSAALDTPQGKVFCLQKALALNPGNEAAKRGLAALEKAYSVAVTRAGVGTAVSSLAEPERTVVITGTAERPPARTLSRVARYTAVRTLGLLATVAVAVYLMIFVANLGGYVDEIVKSRIDQAVAAMLQGGWLKGVPQEEKLQIVEETIHNWREAEGLFEPFLLRCLRWLGDGLTLNWGESRTSNVILGGVFSREVKDIILDALPRTLLMFGTANLLLFVTSILLALALTRRHGSWLDRTIIALSPMSAAPAWILGIIINVLLFRVLGFISWGGALDAWPDEFKWAYVPQVLKHMLLPFLAIFLSGLFQSVYAWRTFFLLYSSEDHVEVARAKGLPPRMVERRYILRPALPAVLTSFALLLMGLWQESIALEKFFYVWGIGQLFHMALLRFDIPVILGLVVTFSYILAFTVFLLDIFYALVDPRVRVGSEGQTMEAASRRGIRARLARLRDWRRRRPKAIPDSWRVPEPARVGRPAAAHKSAKAAHKSAKAAHRSAKATLQDWTRELGRSAAGLRPMLRELVRYRPAIAGLAIIAALIVISIYTMITLPYGEALRIWGGEDDVWLRTPANAAPEWINALREEDLPPSIILDTRENENATPSLGTVTKSSTVVSEDMTDITLSFTFDYPYGEIPQDMAVYVAAQSGEKMIQVSLTWIAPDGREIRLVTRSIMSALTYYPDQDDRLRRKMGDKPPLLTLFTNPSTGQAPLKGTYELRVTGLVFEENTDLDAELVLDGRIYGLVGTDGSGRDLIVPLLWGAPIALSFGLLAAVGASVSTMVFAGISVWFGGWVDSLVQRITEVNMLLPFLPVSIMIYTLYSQSFWVVMAVTVALSIFGRAIKNYRAIFLQLKEAPYIEAARSYGAGDWRIVFRYLLPRISAVLIPQIVLTIPGFIFLEATLTYLGVGMSGPPTWGTLVVQMLSRSHYAGDYFVVLVPLSLLLLTGFAFALVGMGLERFFEPRLRDR